MNKEEQKLFIKTIRVAKTLGLKNIRITPGLIAGASDDRMVLMLHPTDIQFPFGSAGIGQIDTLHNIIEMFDGPLEMSVETTVDADNLTHAKKVTASSGRVRASYRFAHPAVVVAPKNTRETPWITIPRISADITGFIDKGIRAMQSDTLMLHIVNNKLVIEAKDLHGEAVTIETEVEVMGEEGIVDNADFQYRKDVARIIAHSLEHNGVSISKRGFMFCQFDGITILLAPFVKDE